MIPILASQLLREVSVTPVLHFAVLIYFSNYKDEKCAFYRVARFNGVQGQIILYWSNLHLKLETKTILGSVEVGPCGRWSLNYRYFSAQVGLDS